MQATLLLDSKSEAATHKYRRAGCMIGMICVSKAMAGGMSRLLGLCHRVIWELPKDAVSDTKSAPSHGYAYWPLELRLRCIISRGASTTAKELAGSVVKVLGQHRRSSPLGMQRSREASGMQHLVYPGRALVSIGPRLGGFEPPGVPFTETRGTACLLGELAKASPD